MNKQALRKIYLQKRMALSDVEYLQRNKQICNNFFASVDLSAIKVLHTFLPIAKNREVNTWLIIDRINRDYPDIQISIPKVNNQSAAIDNFYYENADQVEKNLWEIPEPKHGIPTPNEKIDAILVPLLAVDKKGHRVGYGRGFYDKFLATCRKDCQKIGLSFFEVVDEIEGIEGNDVPLNVVITPENGVLL